MQHSSSAGSAVSNGTVPSESADDDLPSVMTCANYLKLPPYSTKVLLCYFSINVSQLSGYFLPCLMLTIGVLETGNYA